MEFLSSAFKLYIEGVHVFADFHVIALILLGGIIGTVFGLLPGLTSTMALALMTPVTFWFDANDAIVFLIVIYATSMWAGSVTAIVLNIPGTPGAIVTGLDGYPMTQRGEAGRAIAAATMSSAVGGIIGMIVLSLVAMPFAEVALGFLSWEYAALAFLGISLIAFVSGRSILRGLTSGVFGLLIATIGLDVISGFPRFTMGFAELTEGVNLVPVLIGFFGLAEVLSQLEKREFHLKVTQKITNILPVLAEVFKYPFSLIRSAIIGVFIGALPGAGGAISSVTSYTVGKQLSKHSEKFGTGLTEGIINAESANNACVGGALIPMLTLGIPGDMMTAVLLGNLMIHGLTPGPRFFAEHPVFISSIFISLTIGSLMILIIGLVGAKFFTRVLSTPSYILMPIILLLCAVGSFAIRNSVFDIGVAIACGTFGYMMRKVDLPMSPLVLGVVLGPILEENVTRALLLTGGDPTPFFTRPISLGVILFALLILLVPPLIKRLRQI